MKALTVDPVAGALTAAGIVTLDPQLVTACGEPLPEENDR